MGVADYDISLFAGRAPVKEELVCGECGYGIVAADLPDECPMCRASSWRSATWRPFSRLAEFLPRGPERPPAA